MMTIDSIGYIYDDYLKLTRFHQPIQTGREMSHLVRIPYFLKTELEKEAVIRATVSRAKRTIFDYIMCNDFNFFLTLTFDPKVLRADDLSVSNVRVKEFLRRCRRIMPDFSYIIVPERHKSGRVHYHAVINVDHKLRPQLVPIRIRNKLEYRIALWDNGFSMVSEINDKLDAAKYLSKYLSKTFEKGQGLGRKRLYSSKGLRRPTVLYNPPFVENMSTALMEKNAVYKTFTRYHQSFVFRNTVDNEIAARFFVNKKNRLA